MRKCVCIIGVLAFATSAMGANLTNGDFEGGFTAGGVGLSWYNYIQGNQNGVKTWSAQAGDASANSQGIYHSIIRDDRNIGNYQILDANVGDAFAFSARVWCDRPGSGTYGTTMSLEADWDGGTSVLASDMQLTGARSADTWTSYGPANAAGNATGTSVTLFLNSKGASGTKHTSNMRWDNVIAYRTHVPLAVTLSGETDSSLDMDVNLGDNIATNEYAISIIGGVTLHAQWPRSDVLVASFLLHVKLGKVHREYPF